MSFLRKSIKEKEKQSKTEPTSKNGNEYLSGKRTHIYVFTCYIFATSMTLDYKAISMFSFTIELFQ